MILVRYIHHNTPMCQSNDLKQPISIGIMQMIVGDTHDLWHFVSNTVKGAKA